MRRMQGDPAHRERLARAGHEAFLARWCERAVIPRYLEVVAGAARRKGDRNVLAKLEVAA